MSTQIQREESETEKFEVDEGTRDENDAYKCGIGRFHPAFMQRCADIRMFTFNYSMMSLTSMCFKTYVASQITTLEKQFQLSSTQSSMFLTCNEIGFILGALFVTHAVRKSHIPRILGISGCIIGIIGLVNSIPHFVMLPKKFFFYEYGDTRRDPITSVRRCYGNGSDVAVNMTSQCVESEQSEFKSVRTIALGIICFGMAVFGAARGPWHGISTSYIDDNIDKTKTGYHIGVIAGVGIFGPVLAFVTGALFNLKYVTLLDTPLDRDDPRWIGAWWLGFIVFGTCTSLVSVWLLFFPKSFQKEHNHKEERLASQLRDFPSAILRLCRNSVWVLINIPICASAFVISGTVSFYPKYYELQFKMLPWMANIVFGVSVVAAASFGAFISGIIVSRFKMAIRGCLMVKFVTECIFLLGCVPLIFIGCDPINYHNHDVYGSQLSNTTSCNDACACNDTDFLPVCGSDGKTYFSPCLAGCMTAGNETFEDCACIGVNGTAMPRLCEPVCSTFIPYVTIYCVMTLIKVFNLVPSVVINIRIVEESDKALSIGLTNVLTSLTGWMLGPLVFGRVIDSTCILWGSQCGQRGACDIYDINDLRIKFHVLLLVPMGISVAFCALVLFLVMYTGKYKSINSTADCEDIFDDNIQ